jgi:hypothetical protein
MLLEQVLLLHLMVGVAVAAAVYLSSQARHRGEHWFQVISALVFWPMYLPLLLTRQASVKKEREPVPAPPCQDELAQAIAQVDAELDGALQSLGGWAEDVLARERGRLHELRSAWVAQAERIREMDRLLRRPEYGENGVWSAAPTAAANSERLRHSQQVIQRNIGRLKQVRERAVADLLGTLAWVRELVSMIHLAKFTGAPAARAEELVAQIAAAVEGLSAVTWQEEAAVE